MTTLPTTTLHANDEVLGYRLQHPLGSGGYGEVWAADAPGGLTKAIKFIYGFHDDERARIELKALGRIKQVRHPFLISLERIDIYDGRLVIVSELADRSLRETLADYQQQGSAGIPRELLLRFLWNAAEALDFLSSEYSLQHLDVKPDNLLVIGQHVKVADFGLVKSFDDLNQSILDGVTPTYAAPELFDGKPSRHSDQYSLAVVYQELLTGKPPFDGSSVAQLANQHLSSLPDLRALPPGDQAVIARALSKVPEQRYPSCCDMLQDLERRRHKSKNSNRPNQRSSPSDGHQDVTLRMTPSDTSSHARKTSLPPVETAGNLGLHCTSVEKLGALACDSSQSAVRPTLFLGVGHTGGQILARIKQQLELHADPMAMLPAISLLYLDTDRQHQFALTTAPAGHPRLSSHEVLAIPLKSREQYRQSSKEYSWLSRRWLFNVPRSLQTERLRPLGRLALADHFDQVYQTLLDQLNEIARPEALAETAEALKLLPADESPRVVLVGSICGGLGSGTLLDLAQMVRAALSQLGFDDNLTAVLCHSIADTGDLGKLALANSFCFLRDYNHYVMRGYYGDNSFDLPDFDPGPIFDQIYLHLLGTNRDPHEYDQRIDSIAQHLYLMTASRWTQVFEASRFEDGDSEWSLRASGVASATSGGLGIVRHVLPELTQRVLAGWNEPPSDLSPDLLKQLVQERLRQVGLHSKTMEERWLHLERQVWKHGIMASLAPAFQELAENLQDRPDARDQQLKSFFHTIEQLAAEGDPHTQHSLYQLFHDQVPELANEVKSGLSAAIMELVDQPEFRIEGARQFTQAMSEALSDYAKSLKDHLRELASSHQRIHQELVGPTLSSGNDSQRLEWTPTRTVKLAEQLAIMRFQMVTCSATMSLVQMVADGVESAMKLLNNMQLSASIVQRSLSLPPDAAHDSTRLDSKSTVCKTRPTNPLIELFVKLLGKRMKPMVAAANELLARKSFGGHGSLHELLQDQAICLRDLPDLVTSACRHVIADSVRQIRLDELINATPGKHHDLTQWLQDNLRQAAPSGPLNGGKARLLLALPETNSHSRAVAEQLSQLVAEAALQQPTTLTAESGDLLLCYEVSNISLANIASQLATRREDFEELLSKLSVRNDVEWTHLLQFA